MMVHDSNPGRLNVNKTKGENETRFQEKAKGRKAFAQPPHAGIGLGSGFGSWEDAEQPPAQKVEETGESCG